MSKAFIALKLGDSKCAIGKEKHLMSLKKRGLSLLLAVVMAIGLVPATMFSALAASPPAGVPATLSFGGKKFGVSYDSPNWKK